VRVVGSGEAGIEEFLRRGTYCIRRCVEGLGGTGIGRGAESAEAVQGLIVAERRDKVGRERVHRGPAEARNATAAETGSFVEVWCASERRKMLFFGGEMRKPLEIVVPKLVGPSLVSRFLGMRSGKRACFQLLFFFVLLNIFFKQLYHISFRGKNSFFLLKKYLLWLLQLLS
jgi:hypothetical protein